MKILMLIFIVYVVLQTMYLPASHCSIQPMDGNMIEQTCKQTPFYDLCISSLQSDSRSSNADVKGLALIMFDVLKAKATETRKHINGLLQGSPKPDVKHPLSSCVEKYNAVIKADVQVAIEALEKGDPKFAEQGANDAAIEANLCENSFSGNSPLTDMNKVAHDVSAVAAAIVKILL